MNKIYDFKNKDIKIEFNSIKIGNSAYINQPIEVIEYIEYLQNQLQQKENIIKEVREYIESFNLPKDLGVLGEAPISISELKHILEILDKGE